MARQLNPKYWPARNCFRTRKTIGGEVKTFLGGHGAAGPNDGKARALAVLEIAEQIAEAMNPQTNKSKVQAELDEIVEEQYQEIRISRDLDTLDEMAEEVMQGKPNPLLAEVEQLRADKARLEAQIRLMGSAAQTKDEPLKVILSRYMTLQEQEGKAHGKTVGTITYLKRTARYFVEHLEEREILTTAQLEQATAIVAQYRENYVAQIATDECSHSTAKKDLLGAKQFAQWMVESQLLTRLPPSIGSKWTAVGTDEPNPTFLTVKECQQLFKDAPGKLKLPFILGLNCGYREIDLQSLKREYINLEKGVIFRQRHKANKRVGKPQAHKLWSLTLKLMKEHLAKTEGEPFAKGYSNISIELSSYLKENVLQTPDKRTAKSIRSTGSQELEKVLESKHPRIVAQYLAQGDAAMAKHYRDEDTAGLFQALDKLEKVFGLEE